MEICAVRGISVRHPQIIWSCFVGHSRGLLGFRCTQRLSQCRWKRHGMEKGWIPPSSASAPQQLHLKTLCWLLLSGLKGKKNNIFLSLHETVNPDPSLVEDFVSCPWWWWHLIADENNYHETDWSHCLLVLLVFYEMIIDFNLRSEWTRKWFLTHTSFVPYCADWNYDWGQWLWSIWNFKNQLNGKNYTCASRVWAKMVSPLPTIRYQQFVTVFWFFKSPFSVRQESFSAPVTEKPQVS